MQLSRPALADPLEPPLASPRRRHRILYLEDNPLDALLVRDALDKEAIDCDVATVATREEFTRAVEAGGFDLILADHALPQFDSILALEIATRACPDVPFIVLSGTLASDVIALRRGATDFVSKHQLNRLVPSVRRVLRELEARDAREDFRQREEYFRTLVESVSDLIIVLNPDGSVRYHNPAAQDALGYPREEIFGRSLLEFVHVEERDRVLRAIDALLTEAATTATVEYRFRHREGFWRVLESRARALRGPGGDISLVTLSRDVTERRQTEQEMQKLAAFPRLNPHAVLEFTRDGRLDYFNDAALAMAASLGHNHPAAILPTNTENIVRDAVITGQCRVGVETTLADRVISWSFYPIPSSSYVHCYAEDVTERHRAQERIREQAELLDKAQDAITVRDLNHQVLFWNKGAERLYGWTAAEAAANKASELPGGKDCEELTQARDIVVARGEWSGELHEVAKSGQPLTVQSRWTLVRDAHGEPKSILSISTDITEKKKLETQFFRAQRLDSIGVLASGVAHDLNNILAPIMMAVSLLQESSADEKNSKLLETLRASALRGADMVKQILTFTRGQEGKRGAVNLRHLINELVKIARETFPRSIQTKSQVAKNLWPITADATQMHQVIMNLAVNARDAMPNGGSLMVQAENVLLDENYVRLHLDARPGSYIVITVADNGTGIDPSIIDQIYDPFFTTKECGKGTGLGLYTALSIVKSHGGFINVYSEPGKGTRFRIYLPAAEPSAMEKQPELKLEPPHGHGERILVVDDERAFQEITRAIFTKFGYKVLTANDGTEAVALFAQHRDEIDLVITDLMMPFLDGPATIRALQRMDPDVRVIAASGMVENESIASKLPNTTFLPKPFTTERLLMTVDQALHNRPATQP